MDVTLICFSQTGNTRQVAAAMAGAFREAGHPARIVPLKETTPGETIGGDLLGVGTPCFSHPGIPSWDAANRSKTAHEYYHACSISS